MEGTGIPQVRHLHRAPAHPVTHWKSTGYLFLVPTCSSTRSAGDQHSNVTLQHNTAFTVHLLVCMLDFALNCLRPLIGAVSVHSAIPSSAHHAYFILRVPHI